MSTFSLASTHNTQPLTSLFMEYEETNLWWCRRKFNNSKWKWNHNNIIKHEGKKYKWWKERRESSVLMVSEFKYLNNVMSSSEIWNITRKKEKSFSLHIHNSPFAGCFLVFVLTECVSTPGFFLVCEKPGNNWSVETNSKKTFQTLFHTCVSSRLIHACWGSRLVSTMMFFVISLLKHTNLFIQLALSQHGNEARKTALAVSYETSNLISFFLCLLDEMDVVFLPYWHIREDIKICMEHEEDFSMF